MKILIIAEEIGVNEEVDSKIKGIVREFSDDSEIHTYSRKFYLSEDGEYLRMKGVEIHTIETTLVATIPKEYDAIIAFDNWAKKESASFSSAKKILVTDKATDRSLIEEINEKEVKQPSQPVKKPKEKQKAKAMTVKK